jgi:hypothetical protein
VQTSNSSRIVKSLLEADEVDPKAIALSTQFGSDAYEELMYNFNKHVAELVRRARASGALSGEEPEMLALKAIVLIAAENFFPDHIPGARGTLKNLRRFL